MNTEINSNNAVYLGASEGSSNGKKDEEAISSQPVLAICLILLISTVIPLKSAFNVVPIIFTLYYPSGTFP